MCMHANSDNLWALFERVKEWTMKVSIQIVNYKNVSEWRKYMLVHGFC